MWLLDMLRPTQPLSPPKNTIYIESESYSFFICLSEAVKGEIFIPIQQIASKMTRKKANQICYFKPHSRKKQVKARGGECKKKSTDKT